MAKISCVNLLTLCSVVLGIVNDGTLGVTAALHGTAHPNVSTSRDDGGYADGTEDCVCASRSSSLGVFENVLSLFDQEMELDPENFFVDTNHNMEEIFRKAKTGMNEFARTVKNKKLDYLQMFEYDPFAVQPDWSAVLRPRSVDEVQRLVKEHHDSAKTLRVIGSAHSWPQGMYQPDHGGSLICLDHINHFKWKEDLSEITVGAGMKLGHISRHSYFPFKISDENTLVYLLRQKKKAVPDLGGIYHQSVAGFLLNGCAGFTNKHSIYDSIQSISLIDGKGTLKTYTRSDDLNDEFYGVGVSMGLLGVVVEITLKVVDEFNLVGSQVASVAYPTKPKHRYHLNSALDVFASEDSNGRLSLESFFDTHEFARVTWSTQPPVNKIVTWTAWKETHADRERHPSMYAPNDDGDFVFQPKPFTELKNWHQAALHLMFFHRLNNPPPYSHIQRRVLNAAMEAAEPNIDTRKPSSKTGIQEWWDSWCPAMSPDYEAMDNLLPVKFTEIWFPKNESARVMKLLKEYFASPENREYLYSGNFQLELYPSPPCDFWLSPSHSFGVLKAGLNYMWSPKNRDPIRTFAPFWKLFRDNSVPFRFHWGKYKQPDSWAYTQSQYSKVDQFLELRRKNDPKNIFLTPYWREHLVGPEIRD